ncbi:MAG: hypothetical protein RIQ88_37 [Actinomycetota bacterium]|jgi:aminoglycoside phosphotransferase (APT) family kinase protein
MGKPSLILAALAADALPGLRFTSVLDLSVPGSEITSHLLSTDSGQLVMFKSPNSAIAMTELGLEVRALRVLKNVDLPFKIPALLGETSVKAIRKALAFDYVLGNPVDFSRLKETDLLVGKLAQTIAKIHSIPAQLVIDAGLPEYDPALRVRERVAEFDRAMETGRIPSALLERWQNALLDVSLFRYQPSVVHGSLTGDCLLTDGTEVIGINNWSNLCVDDPAVDLASLLAEANTAIADALLLAYEGSIRADRNLKQRANLYYELSFASYLLQAIAANDDEQIEEAIELLNQLNESLTQGVLPSLRPTELSPTNPEVITPISQASSFTNPIPVITEQIETIENPEIDK